MHTMLSKEQRIGTTAILLVLHVHYDLVGADVVYAPLSAMMYCADQVDEAPVPGTTAALMAAHIPVFQRIKLGLPDKGAPLSGLGDAVALGVPAGVPLPKNDENDQMAEKCGSAGISSEASKS